MVRLILKGGIWKNSEDEILKAAIMKYGLNQWARVASLLPRKTAATCKARWFEWLDPSIRKTEWTREEEERLLHLAKLMPSQWRTIAPLVGRTAAQCVEHYERLLDAAQSKDDEISSSRQDHTKLRPGEIDPMPEVKPARPDPVDMDEDEKEMLSEARARLANTKGKKAKRKVRERMLDEARHLASLQKARELKAAGIESKKRPRRPTDGIDYANEIPFERRAPAGFFDTSQEDAKYITDKAAETDDFKITLLNNIEKKRRSEEEAIEREKDKKKIRGAISRNLPAALVAEAEKDPLNVRKRAKLALPAPLMSESDLEEAARIGMAVGSSGGFDLDEEDDSTTSVITRGLVGSYSINPSAMMTTSLLSRGNGPSAASSREAILEEARNQRTLRTQETPLLGGENADLEGGTGFSGATPVVRNGASSRVMGGEKESIATPFMPRGIEIEGRRSGSSASVIGGSSVISGTGSSVVFRDALGINRGGQNDGGSVFGDSASAFGDGVSVRDSIDGLFQREHVEKITLGLRSLPKPRGNYEFMVPDLPSNESEEDSLTSVRRSLSGSSTSVPDAREAEIRAHKLAEAARAMEFARQSAVIRRVPGLPRPIVLDDDAIAPPVGNGNNYFAVAEGMINDELLAVLKSDAFKYPVNHKFFKAPKHAQPLVVLSDDILAQARRLLDDEFTNLRIQAENVLGGELDGAALSDVWDASVLQDVYLPLSHRIVSRDDALSDQSLQKEYVVQLKQRFDALKATFSRDNIRISKAVQRISLLTKGLENRCVSLAAESVELAKREQSLIIERKCLERIAHNEQVALVVRLASATESAQNEVERERSLQHTFAELTQGDT